MANVLVEVFLGFSDGSFASLQDSIAEGTTGEVQTGGSGLAQVVDVSVGQAFTGKTCISAIARCTVAGGNTGAYVFGYFQSPAGDIICPIQGGGAEVSGLQPLYKPVRMQTGITCRVRPDIVADGTGTCALTVVCASGKTDVFFADNPTTETKTSLVNKNSATIGQALENEVIVAAFATVPFTNSISEASNGIGGLFIESAEGTLKAVYPPLKGNQAFPSAYMNYRVPIMQNDTASILSDTN